MINGFTIFEDISIYAGWLILKSGVNMDPRVFLDEMKELEKKEVKQNASNA
jgi:hypothetical protein